jgi:hypothetical protein
MQPGATEASRNFPVRVGAAFPVIDADIYVPGG